MYDHTSANQGLAHAQTPLPDACEWSSWDETTCTDVTYDIGLDLQHKNNMHTVIHVHTNKKHAQLHAVLFVCEHVHLILMELFESQFSVRERRCRLLTGLVSLVPVQRQLLLYQAVTGDYCILYMGTSYTA